MAFLVNRFFNRRRIGLILCVTLAALYIGSYLVLSLQGRYEPSVVGGNGVKRFQWAPRGFVTDFLRWDRTMSAVYFPLHFLDTSLWHTPDLARSERYPANEVSGSERVYREWGAEPWFALQYSLSDYVEMQPGRPIIVSFGADWAVSSEMNWRILFSEEITAVLQDAGFLCLVADITEGDAALAKTEMKDLERAAVPVTAVYDPVAEAWDVKPEVFSADDMNEWVISIQDKMADQGDAPK